MKQGLLDRIAAIDPTTVAIHSSENDPLEGVKEGERVLGILSSSHLQIYGLHRITADEAIAEHQRLSQELETLSSDHAEAHLAGTNEPGKCKEIRQQMDDLTRRINSLRKLPDVLGTLFWDAIKTDLEFDGGGDLRLGSDNQVIVTPSSKRSGRSSSIEIMMGGSGLLGALLAASMMGDEEGLGFGGDDFGSSLFGDFPFGGFSRRGNRDGEQAQEEREPKEESTPPPRKRDRHGRLTSTIRCHPKNPSGLVRKDFSFLDLRASRT